MTEIEEQQNILNFYFYKWKPKIGALWSKKVKLEMLTTTIAIPYVSISVKLVSNKVYQQSKWKIMMVAWLALAVES